MMTRTGLLPMIAVGGSPGFPADIDCSVADFKTPADIKWVRNAAGTNESAVLFGDPSKPGPYVSTRLRKTVISQGLGKKLGRKLGGDCQRLGKPPRSGQSDWTTTRPSYIHAQLA